MPVRSRYAASHAGFGRNLGVLRINQAGTHDTESYLRNIVSGQYGKIIASCWPIPEVIDKGRRWGQFGSARAMIMPFRARMGSLPASLKLDNFELELFLCEAVEQDFGPGEFPSPCSEQPCPLHSGIYLLDLPVPKHEIKSPVLSQSTSSTDSQPWKFRSEDIADCDGRARAARWEWVANGHDPVLLYGGLAARHLDEPFIVACRVRGKAYIELPNSRGRFIFQLADVTERPKWWKVVPQDSTQDLSSDVHSLEADIQILNSNCVPSAPTVSSFASTSDRQGHYFGPPSISGSAHVIMGNATYANPLPQ